MKTFILKIEDSYINSLMEFIKPIPKNDYDLKSLDVDAYTTVNLLEDEIAYLKGLIDLEKGDVIELNEYMAKRGLA
jgi:hypothetical protein